jgi:hypothetical protein
MWKRLFLPLALVLVLVIAVTIWFGTKYGLGFWENFLAQLKKDLIAEADVNSKRIITLRQLFQSALEKKPNELTWGDPLIKSILQSNYHLRTEAMKNISKPENIVLVTKLELADYLEWLLPQSELYNTELTKSLNQFLHLKSYLHPY